jgi:hypothetical protein
MVRPQIGLALPSTVYLDVRRRVGRTKAAMWHTPAGDRVLSPGEWALVRAGLDLAWDAVEVAAEAGTDAATGVRAFDVLKPGQQVALLALVGTAVSNPTVPAPPLTAATEGALAAVLAQVRAELEMELDASDSTACQRLILGAVGNPAGRDRPLPAPADRKWGEWEMLIDEIESRVLWDTEYALGDLFLDRSPEETRADMVLHGSTRTTSSTCRTIPIRRGWRRPAGRWPK